MPSEFTFRAQLVTKEQRRIYDYWSRQAGKRIMPGTQDFDVNNITNLTHSLSLIKIHSDLSQSTYTSAGSSIQDLYECCLKDMPLSEVISEEKEGYWLAVVKNLVKCRAPRVGVVQNRAFSAVFWLRLPLSRNGADVTDILCHDQEFSMNPGRKEFHVSSTEHPAVAVAL